MANELILVKQLPVLEEKFREKGAEIEEKVQNARSMTVTEENYKDIKKIRAGLNKESKAYADEFKVVKAQVLDPWLKIEEAYKSNIRDKYAAADQALKQKIGEVEKGLRDEKEKEIRAYYEEYAEAIGVDFCDWDRAGIKVGLSDSKKKLKEESKALLDKIISDLELIETQENKEAVLAEYKISLDVSKAVTTVKDRIEREEAERIAAAQRAERAAAEKQHDEEVRSHFTEPVAPPVMRAPEPEPMPKPERVPFIAFKVYGSINALKAVVEFLNAAGYSYEQIKEV